MLENLPDLIQDNVWSQISIRIQLLFVVIKGQVPNKKKLETSKKHNIS